MVLENKATLNNGVKMPRIGLGVWQIENDNEIANAVNWALEAGYRMIDTAARYGNEEGVGHAIRNSNIPREEIFVTTKLWNDDQGYDIALKAFDTSLKKLGLDYIDLYLIHWPVRGKRLDSWKALIEIYKSGRTKAIGVSNFTVEHLQELMETSNIIPAVNQVEFHPFLYQKELMEFCKAHDIQLEAYSPLTSGGRVNDENISKIAKKYGKSNAQIFIRWSLQHGNIVIPKSTRKERIIENISVFDFEISSEDMNFIDSLNENFRTCWNPADF